jgi:hypothetical protein
MDIRPSNSAFFRGEKTPGVNSTNRSRTGMAFLMFLVELNRNKVEVEVVSDDGLGKEIVEVGSPFLSAGLGLDLAHLKFFCVSQSFT